MIEAWFNERGYKVQTEKGESKFVYDLPAHAIDNAATLYSCRWMVLNHLMETIQSLKETIQDKELILCTDSRLVEELQGELKPDGNFAKASLRYFIEKDFVTFRCVKFYKCTSRTIEDKLSEPINSERLTAT